VEGAQVERARAFAPPPRPRYREGPRSSLHYTQRQYNQYSEGAGPWGPDLNSPWGPDLNLTFGIDQSTLGRFVPGSFIGISREYTNESVYWDRNLEAWGAILNVLGPSPIIRIGGASQEALTAPPTADYLRSLVTLHCALGVRFIIGLPLFQNAPALALQIKQAFQKAFQNFPRAIVSFELGNEVGGQGCFHKSRRQLWRLQCVRNFQRCSRARACEANSMPQPPTTCCGGVAAARSRSTAPKPADPPHSKTPPPSPAAKLLALRLCGRLHLGHRPAGLRQGQLPDAPRIRPQRRGRVHAAGHQRGRG
jgi:hypothetical protein